MNNPTYIAKNGEKKELMRASPGGGCLIYGDVDRHNRKMKVILGMRDPSVGEGLGLTFSGYYEVLKFYNHFKGSKGAIQSGLAEVYREGKEEVPGIWDIIDIEYFADNAEPCLSAMIIGDDINPVHVGSSLLLYLEGDKRKELLSTGPSPEQLGLIECILTWSKDIKRFMSGYISGVGTCWKTAGEEIAKMLKIEGTDEEFFHQHDIRVLAELVWRAENERLWTKRI